MKTKLDSLEIKVDLQDSLIIKLEKELAKANEKIVHLLMEENNNEDDIITSSKSLAIKPSKFQTQYRTCYEFYLAYKEIGIDSNKVVKSGHYYIDVDGPGVGEPALYVYCNMTDGIFTIIILNPQFNLLITKSIKERL